MKRLAGCEFVLKKKNTIRRSRLLSLVASLRVATFALVFAMFVLFSFVGYAITTYSYIGYINWIYWDELILWSTLIRESMLRFMKWHITLCIVVCSSRNIEGMCELFHTWDIHVNSEFLILSSTLYKEKSSIVNFHILLPLKFSHVILISLC